VEDWLTLLAGAQPAALRDSEAARLERTLVLAVLRGGLLDLLATGDTARRAAGSPPTTRPGRTGPPDPAGAGAAIPGR
ncbi:hypothetical protein ACFV2G_19925, partial [Streptomyces sp. NPDC059701]